MADHWPAGQPLGGQGADKILPQDIQHGRPHQAPDHAHRYQRQRNDRQHEILQPFIQRQRVVTHALGRQPVMEYCAGHHQDDGAPVMRQRYANRCDSGKYLVRPAAVIQRRSHAAEDAHGEAEDGGQDCQNEGIFQRNDKLAPDRRRVEHGQAEIALHGPHQPKQILHVQRLIEAECRFHLRDHLG